MVGCDKWKEILEANLDRPLLIYGDPDVDGLFSLKYEKDFADFLGFKKYSYYVNDNRQHGFNMELADHLSGWLVISADFGITQEEMQTLVDKDVVVLATDHHEVQDDFILCKDKNGVEKGILLCNQYPFEPFENKYLSGAGVFYELLCELYPSFKTPERDALVGITLLSDVCPIENNDRAFCYLRTTYGADTSRGYLKHLVEDSLGEKRVGFGVPRLDNNFINFTLSPLLNSLLRFDRKQEAIAFILGDALSDTSSRGKQKTLVNYMVEKCRVLDFPSVHILSIVYEEVVSQFPGVDPRSFLGVACNQYMREHGNVSTLGFINRKDGTILRTSFRGKFSDINYNRSFRNLGFDIGGHATAFGIKNFMPKPSTWGEIGDLIADLEYDHPDTFKVVPVNNLAMAVQKTGMALATANCYVRDAYRTFYKYTGSAIVERRKSYSGREISVEEHLQGVKYDEIKDGELIVWNRDENGNPIPKYIEYEVDGRLVKSFGTILDKDAFILPLLENGYITLYVKEPIK